MLAIVLGLLPLAACQMLAGGPMTVDVNRDDIQKMATFALGELNTLLGEQNTLVKVVSAQTQVVAGINYIMSLQLQQNGANKICDVTVWSRAWLNDDRLTKHVCSANKRDVGLHGAPVTTDVHRTDVQSMAGFALSKVNQLTRVSNTLVEIVSAKTQVIAGTNYIMTIRITDGTSSRTCDVTVWYQAWLNSKKLTKNTCTASSRRRTVMLAATMLPYVPDPRVQQMANIAVSELNRLQGVQNTLVEVIAATVQVVAGWNYNLLIRLRNGGETQICNVTVWTQPWLNNNQITENSCSKVTKRDGSLLGGPTYIDINSPQVKKMAAFAVTELNGLQKVQNTLVKVLTANKQMVAGVDYFLKLSLQNGGKTQICDVEIWDQPWLHKTELISQHCTAGTSTSKRAGLLGGVEPATLSEPVQKAVSFAEDALNAKSNNMFRMVTEKVDNITQQIVAGIKYTFDLVLVTSTCTNTDGSNKGKTIHDCPARPQNAPHQTCSVSVMVQVWAKPQYTLLSDKCGSFY